MSVWAIRKFPWIPPEPYVQRSACDTLASSHSSTASLDVHLRIEKLLTSSTSPSTPFLEKNLCRLTWKTHGPLDNILWPITVRPFDVKTVQQMRDNAFDGSTSEEASGTGLPAEAEVKLLWRRASELVPVRAPATVRGLPPLEEAQAGKLAGRRIHLRVTRDHGGRYQDMCALGQVHAVGQRDWPEDAAREGGCDNLDPGQCLDAGVNAGGEWELLT